MKPGAILKRPRDMAMESAVYLGRHGDIEYVLAQSPIGGSMLLWKYPTDKFDYYWRELDEARDNNTDN